MNSCMNSAGDQGNIAIELLVFGIALPALILGFSLTAFSAQRSSMAAEQLAREAVRFAATGSGDAQTMQLLQEQITEELSLSTGDISLVLIPKPSGTGVIFEAKASVRGAEATALMRKQD